MIEPTQEQHLKAFLGAGLAPKHWPAFARFEQGKKFIFSWSAAFWSFFWFFYHKMYLAGFLLLIIFQGSNLLAHQLLDSTLSYFVVEGVHLVIMAVFTGLFSWRLYYRFCVAKISQLEAKYSGLTSQDFQKILQRHGGHQLKGILIVCGAIFMALITFLAVVWVLDPTLLPRPRNLF